MSRLDQHGRMQQAIVLIRRGLRTSIVSRISGVGPALLRELQPESVAVLGCAGGNGLDRRDGGIADDCLLHRREGLERREERRGMPGPADEGHEAGELLGHGEEDLILVVLFLFC